MWLLLLLVVGVCADWDIREHLGTKSPYWSEGSTTPSPIPDGCTAIHLDLLSRHGARYPTNGDITALISLSSKIQQYSSYINDSFAYIKSWTNPYPLSQQGFLSLTGQQGLFELGQRMNATYFPLLSEPYSPDVYKMQSTQIPRTGVSASAFAQGFLQGKGDVGSFEFQPPYIYSDTPSLDYLRFFDNCPEYTQARQNGTISTSEADKYGDMVYPPIASRIAQTLGVSGVWNITVDDLDAMFTACAFEVSVFEKVDGWCTLFSPSDIDVYEYASDLEDYWVKSYGSGIGYQISAVILQSIIGTMDGVIANASGYGFQNAYLRFAHAEDVLPFAALLGLFPSDPLTADLSQSQIEDRNWTSSVISPFGANLALTLYQCSSGDTYRVKLTHNEVEYTFPGCSDLYCPYTELKSLYAEPLVFNFTQACALPTREFAPKKDSVSLLVFSIAVVVAFAIGAIMVLFFSVVYFRKHRKVRYSSLSA